MTATDTSRDETAECISESHAEFMRSFCAYEERVAKATVERFLRLKLKKASIGQFDEVE
jgi:hypothetical protein